MLVQNKTEQNLEKESPLLPVWKVSGRHVTCAVHNNKVGAQLGAQNKLVHKNL